MWKIRRLHTILVKASRNYLRLSISENKNFQTYIMHCCGLICEDFDSHILVMSLILTGITKHLLQLHVSLTNLIQTSLYRNLNFTLSYFNHARTESRVRKVKQIWRLGLHFIYDNEIVKCHVLILYN